MILLMEPKTVIFVGRSGCGKGTQVEILSKTLSEKTGQKVFHLEAGSHFRKFIGEPFYASRLAKKINDEGGLQPEFLSVWAWSEELVKNLNENDHLIIDGTPRRLAETKILESALDFFNRKKVEVIYMNVSNEWSIARMVERHRVDDVPASMKKRLAWFDTEVMPVINFFRESQRYSFFDIPSERSIEEISQDITNQLAI